MDYSNRREFVAAAGTAAASLAAGCLGGASSGSRTVTVDYAYYNPVSLVLRENGWVEEEFNDTDADVNWVLSLGSNEANQYSQSGEAEFLDRGYRGADGTIERDPDPDAVHLLQAGVDRARRQQRFGDQ